jgi:hypothetical protein
MRIVLVSPLYSQVGAALTPGALNTLVFKFGQPEVISTSTSTPTRTPTATARSVRRTPTPTATTPRYLGPLELDWVLESQGPNPVNRDQWLVVANLIARGGDGQYTFFHDGLPVSSSRVEVVDRKCRNKPGSFWVQDGTGQFVKKNYYLFAPDCPNTP